MQPYFFPYIGYFQLIYAVDKFVIYDDVNYIKKGWVNRNRILVNGSSFMFTLPIHKPSQNIYIRDTEISSNYKNWKAKFRTTLIHVYKKSAFFEENISIIDQILDNEDRMLSKYINHGLNIICQTLDIKTEIAVSSGTYKNSQMKAQKRIIDICKQEKASTYINAIGGVKLYEAEQFNQDNIELYFLESKEVKYQQKTKHYVPYLSILDQLMYTGIKNTKESLFKYSLIKGQ